MKIIFLLALLFISIECGFAQDTTNGIVWYPPIQLSDSTWSAGNPTIAVSDNDIVHVAWTTDKDIAGVIRLPYARSIDGGQSFEPVRELLPDSSNFPRIAYYPHVVTEGERVYFFFINSEPYYYTSPLRMITSIDYGVSFDKEKNISGIRISGASDVSISNGSIVCVIAKDIRTLIRSTNKGTNLNYSQDNSHQVLEIFL